MIVIFSMATFVEDLSTLWGGPLTTTLTMGGAVRVRLERQQPWGPLRQLLGEHDKDMTLNEGVATFTPIADVLPEGKTLPEPSKVVTAGPLTSTEYTGLCCTSADLNKAADEASVLRVLIGKTVTVEKINPSDIKDGLHHLHRRGKVKPIRTHISKRACTSSTAARKANDRLKRRLSLYRKAVRFLGISD